jgi:transcriptional regulator with XRE-family HTH domain
MLLISKAELVSVPADMATKKITLGRLIRGLREQRGWTLREMSAKVGIPLSTLAKVETDKLSLTYEKLQQLSTRLGMSLTEFLALGEPAPADAARPVITARRSLTTPDNTVRISTPNYDYEYLCTDLREKRMVPIVTRIKAHDIVEFGKPSAHQGEEFLYVLEGAIEVHLQFYAPVIVRAGHGIYLDSTMQHAFTARDCDSALVLAVCSSEDPQNLAQELMSRVSAR